MNKNMRISVVDDPNDDGQNAMIAAHKSGGESELVATLPSGAVIKAMVTVKNIIKKRADESIFVIHVNRYV